MGDRSPGTAPETLTPASPGRTNLHVIGTAGHVDHGKSSLVHRLTGIHPDRLREEKERQMTIDLGFAWLRLPGGHEVAIIDVPGHRDFVENMLAGVGGMAAALLVVAADEGVRPQTREHIAILDLMNVPRMLVAMNKIDLAPDLEWQAAVVEEVQTLLAGTRFADAPVIPVSAATGEGIPELQTALGHLLDQLVPRPDLGRPRLAIDRAFSMTGFGTVVTGTLLDGTLSVGDEVEILPAGSKARIRGLQTHQQSVDPARPGSRVAANLSGISVGQVARGDVLARPGGYLPTTRLDVRVRTWSAGGVLENQESVKLFTGTAQTLAGARLLGGDRLGPGDVGWVQFDLARPLVVARGDPVILRRPSPAATIGGGEVADPQPERRHRRQDSRVVRRLESYLSQDPVEVLRESLRRRGISPLDVAGEKAGLSAEDTRRAASELSAKGELERVDASAAGEGASNVVVLSEHLRGWSQRVRTELERYHASHPLRRGMPRSELAQRLKMDTRSAAWFFASLEAEREVKLGDTWIALTGHDPAPQGRDRATLEAWLGRMRATPFAPPSWKEGSSQLGPELAAYYLEVGLGIQVAEDLVFDSETYLSMVKMVEEALARKGELTVAEVRDMFATTRKYTLGLLEHLDTLGITKRDGDVRRLGSARRTAS